MTEERIKKLWAFAEKTAKEVSTWPDWKRGIMPFTGHPCEICKEPSASDLPIDLCNYHYDQLPYDLQLEIYLAYIRECCNATHNGLYEPAKTKVLDYLNLNKETRMKQITKFYEDEKGFLLNVNGLPSIVVDKESGIFATHPSNDQQGRLNRSFIGAYSNNLFLLVKEFDYYNLIIRFGNNQSHSLGYTKDLDNAIDWVSKVNNLIRKIKDSFSEEKAEKSQKKSFFKKDFSKEEIKENLKKAAEEIEAEIEKLEEAGKVSQDIMTMNFGEAAENLRKEKFENAMKKWDKKLDYLTKKNEESKNLSSNDYSILVGSDTIGQDKDYLNFWDCVKSSSSETKEWLE